MAPPRRGDAVARSVAPSARGARGCSQRGTARWRKRDVPPRLFRRQQRCGCSVAHEAVPGGTDPGWGPRLGAARRCATGQPGSDRRSLLRQPGSLMHQPGGARPPRRARETLRQRQRSQRILVHRVRSPRARGLQGLASWISAAQVRLPASRGTPPVASPVQASCPTRPVAPTFPRREGGRARPP